MKAAERFNFPVVSFRHIETPFEKKGYMTIAILLALGFWLMGELKFFIPYKAVLLHQYGTAILAFVTVLFFNVFAVVFAVNRRFFLKDTGRKLSHLDKQLQVGQGELPAPSIDSDDEELG